MNDRYGHSTGDALLKAVAERLSNSCRSSDTLCRQGGDEFVVLNPDAPSIGHLQTLARKLVTALEQPSLPGPELPMEITVSASIGVARWPDHAIDADELIEAADTAMYAAKLQCEAAIAIATSIANSDSPS